MSPLIPIPFNQPFLTGNETAYIREAVASGKISGNGVFTQKSQTLLEKRYGFSKVLLTSSGTDALEMAAILCDIQPGDEVIVPSYTFCSSALAFVRQGATIIFADSQPEHPNLDVQQLASLITTKTRAIVVVHYAGIACQMDEIMALADKHHLLVVEDAAQAIDAQYKGRPLGGIGHFGCFSFHETKNVISGEGGALIINDERFHRRAEIIWEKGTNRAEFFRGEIDKYGWVDIGSSFLPSEIIAAFLFAQLENINSIQQKRMALWNAYFDKLDPLSETGSLSLPYIPPWAMHNAHTFYVMCRNVEERSHLIAHLKDAGITAVFHYQSLHKSPYYAARHNGRPLPNTDFFSDCLLRLPLFYDLRLEQVNYISDCIIDFYSSPRPK